MNTGEMKPITDLLNHYCDVYDIKCTSYLNAMTQLMNINKLSAMIYYVILIYDGITKKTLDSSYYYNLRDELEFLLEEEIDNVAILLINNVIRLIDTHTNNNNNNDNDNGTYYSTKKKSKFISISSCCDNTNTTTTTTTTSNSEKIRNSVETYINQYCISHIRDYALDIVLGTLDVNYYHQMLNIYYILMAKRMGILTNNIQGLCIKNVSTSTLKTTLNNYDVQVGDAFYISDLRTIGLYYSSNNDNNDNNNNSGNSTFIDFITGDYINVNLSTTLSYL